MHRPKLLAVILFLIAALIVIFLARSAGDRSPAPQQASPSLEMKDSPSPAPSTANRTRHPTPEKTDLDAQHIIDQMQNLKDAIHDQDFAAALAIADRLMAEEPDDTVALIRARVLISLGRKREAFDALDDILASCEDFEILHQAASRYFIVARDEGLLEEAMSSQEYRLKEAPDDSAILSVMAQLYNYAGDRDSELLIREQLQAQQGSEANLRRIAELQRELGLMDEASASTAELAGKAAPETAAHILLKQAQAENRSDRYDLAANTAKRGLTQPGISDYMAFQLARELASAGEGITALKTFERLAEDGQTREVRDRSTLEACRIQLELGESGRDVFKQLTRLTQSEVSYVQEEAILMLNQLQ